MFVSDFLSSAARLCLPLSFVQSQGSKLICFSTSGPQGIRPRHLEGKFHNIDIDNTKCFQYTYISQSERTSLSQCAQGGSDLKDI